VSPRADVVRLPCIWDEPSPAKMGVGCWRRVALYVDVIARPEHGCEDGAPKQSVVLAAKNSNRFSQLG
jgi:hypothetical protein